MGAFFGLQLEPFALWHSMSTQEMPKFELNKSLNVVKAIRWRVERHFFLNNISS
jgi:hypothetical protein